MLTYSSLDSTAQIFVIYSFLFFLIPISVDQTWCIHSGLSCDLKAKVWLNFLTFIYYTCVHTYACVLAHSCYGTCPMEARKQFIRLVSLFLLCHFWEETQVARLGGKWFSLPSWPKHFCSCQLLTRSSLPSLRSGWGIRWVEGGGGSGGEGEGTGIVI